MHTKGKNEGKRKVNDLLRCGIMHKEEKNDGKKTGFDLLFGVISHILYRRSE
jgi:hypothetical protein